MTDPIPQRRQWQQRHREDQLIALTTKTVDAASTISAFAMVGSVALGINALICRIKAPAKIATMATIRRHGDGPS